MSNPKRPSLFPLLPDFFCKVFRVAVKILVTGIAAGSITGIGSVIFKRLNWPLTHRAVRIPVSIPQNTVNRPLFVLPAFTRFKSAFCGLFLAFALCLPVFSLESPTLGPEIPHRLAQKHAGSKTNNQSGNSRDTGAGSGQIIPEFDQDFFHRGYLIVFCVCFFFSMTLTLLFRIVCIIAQKIKKSRS